MVEQSPKNILPLFDKSILEQSPNEAKYLLKEFWRIQANYTKAVLEEFGIPRDVLVYVATDKINRSLAIDAKTTPETFGTEGYSNKELEENLVTVGKKFSSLCEEPLKPVIKNYSVRFFQEVKLTSIFEHAPVENLIEVCDANGGIPGWTAREQELLANLQ